MGMSVLRTGGPAIVQAAFAGRKGQGPLASPRDRQGCVRSRSGQPERARRSLTGGRNRPSAPLVHTRQEQKLDCRRIADIQLRAPLSPFTDLGRP